MKTIYNYKKQIVSLTSLCLAGWFLFGVYRNWSDAEILHTQQEQEKTQRAKVARLKNDPQVKACLIKPDDDICIPTLKELKDAIDPIQGNTSSETDFLLAYQLYQSAVNSKSPNRIVLYAKAYGFLDEDLTQACKPVPLDRCDTFSKLEPYKKEQDPNVTKLKAALKRVIDRNAHTP